MNSAIEKIDFENSFKDKRLARRMVKTMYDMMEKGTSVINSFCTDKASLIGAYRFFSNENWEVEDFTVPIVEYCSRSLKGEERVLCIQDTSEFNYGKSPCRLSKEDKDVGPVGNNVDTGFFVHPTLVVSCASDLPIGFADIYVYNRSWDKRNKFERGYKRLPMERKESYRWTESALKSARSLPKEVAKVMIGDRESDIYESMWRTLEVGCDFVYRVRVNRYCEGEGMLYERMKSRKVLHVYDLQVPGGRNRKARTAKIELRYCEARILRPKTCLNDGAPSSMAFNYLYVKEKGESVPKGEKPIVWRLQTNMPVNSVEDAKRYIEWYKKRWLIEELFRIVKSEGFRIEDASLGSGMALKKLAAVSLFAALSALTMKRALTERIGQTDCETYFDKDMIDVLKICQAKYDMKEKITKARGNRFREFSLAWAAWIIARLGGWTGYDSTPPGYIRMKNGLDRLFDRYEFFLQLTKMEKDV